MPITVPVLVPEPKPPHTTIAIVAVERIPASFDSYQFLTI